MLGALTSGNAAGDVGPASTADSSEHCPAAAVREGPRRAGLHGVVLAELGLVGLVGLIAGGGTSTDGSDICGSLACCSFDVDICFADIGRMLVGCVGQGCETSSCNTMTASDRTHIDAQGPFSLAFFATSSRGTQPLLATAWDASFACRLRVRMSISSSSEEESSGCMWGYVFKPGDTSSSSPQARRGRSTALMGLPAATPCKAAC